MDVDELVDLEIHTRDLVASLEKEIEEADLHLAPPGQLDGTEGRLSRQDSMIHHEIAKASQTRRHERLIALQACLRRMDLGDFGFCENCGQEMSVARLRARPESTLCDQCATRTG